MDPAETEIFVAVLLASGILGFIIICFITIIVRNHKRFVALHHQQLITEITALESDRKRIVSDLHDDLGPLLAAIKLQIATLDTTLNRDVELIRKASTNVDNILYRIREICYQMLPEVLTRKGLFMAVNELIDDLELRTSMEVAFTCQPVPVSPQAQLHMYRIIQEIINNAVKHSNAVCLHIDINTENDKLILVVRDNGKGFSTALAITANAGLGIKNIYDRTRMLNGDMYLFSEPGKGTTYKIEIPIACNELQDTIDDRR